MEHFIKAFIGDGGSSGGSDDSSSTAAKIVGGIAGLGVAAGGAYTASRLARIKTADPPGSNKPGKPADIKKALFILAGSYVSSGDAKREAAIRKIQSARLNIGENPNLDELGNLEIPSSVKTKAINNAQDLIKWRPSEGDVLDKYVMFKLAEPGFYADLSTMMRQQYGKVLEFNGAVFEPIENVFVVVTGQYPRFVYTETPDFKDWQKLGTGQSDLLELTQSSMYNQLREYTPDLGLTWKPRYVLYGPKLSATSRSSASKLLDWFL